MSEHAPSSSKIMERLIAGVCLAFAFVVLASVIAPDSSHAEDDHATHAEGAHHHHDGAHGSHDMTDHDADHGPSLGTIESGAYRLEIHGGEHGPFYTVIEIATDTVLGEHMTVEQIESRFPDLELPSMNIEDATGPLMMVDDEHHLRW